MTHPPLDHTIANTHLSGAAGSLHDHTQVIEDQGWPRVYIAGPMEGIEGYNYSAFHRAEKELREDGDHPINPATLHNGETALPRHVYMKSSIPRVVDSDEMYLLPGWEDSIGATVELLAFLSSHAPDVNRIRGLDWETEGYLEWLSERLKPGPTSLPKILQDYYNTHGDAFDRELAEIRTLHAAKRADYTGGGRALANYEFSSEMIGVPVIKGMLFRLSEKLFRVKSLLVGEAAPKVSDESIADTLRDIAIIAVLMRLHLSGEGEYSE